MTRKPGQYSLVDSLRENAADCLRQAELEKRRETREDLKGLAQSYLKIAERVERRMQAGP